MSRRDNIVLTSVNQNPNKKNEFIYRLPSTTQFKNHRVSLTYASLYNQFFNITALKGNNTLKLIWNALNTTEYIITFDDGYYSISDINYKIQSFCLLNGLYLINSKGNPEYYIELTTNSILYGSQINAYPLLTEQQANDTVMIMPANSTWSFPTTIQKTPQLEILNQSFGSLLGFNTGVYPATIHNDNIQFVSPLAPKISPISNVFFLSNLINTPYANPSTVLGSTKINVRYGDSIIYQPNGGLIFQDVEKGNYNEIRVSLVDNQFNDLSIIDNDIVIILTLETIV
jgi:hypothetical protein